MTCKTFARQSCSFNTQPPEGGWRIIQLPYNGDTLFQHAAARRRLVPAGVVVSSEYLFQHAAARRRLDLCFVLADVGAQVSTRSRPKAAGAVLGYLRYYQAVSTRSRPKAAGAFNDGKYKQRSVSTRSRPKAAGSGERCKLV